MTFIYKQTHFNDPGVKGLFGEDDCEGSFRNWISDGDAVIGVGGKGRKPRKHGLYNKITWIGLGAKRVGQARRGPTSVFEHYLRLGIDGPSLENYPALRKLLYDNHRRVPFLHSPGSDPQLDREIEAILRLAENAPPSTWGQCLMAA